MNRRCFGRLVSLALAVLLALAPAAGLARPARGESGVGMNIAGFRSVTFAGDPVDGSIFVEAKLTVINIWQRWCGPCWVEMPYFQQLFEHYEATPEADVQLWGALYYDSVSQIQEAVDYVAEMGYAWNEMLICDELMNVACGGENDYAHIPQTLIIDRYGTVRAQVIGKVDSFEELFDLTERWLRTLTEEYEAEAGDVDMDGAVTAADALLALRLAMGLEELDTGMRFRADVNGDGEVDSSDALMILRTALFAPEPAISRENPAAGKLAPAIRRQ